LRRLGRDIEGLVHVGAVLVDDLKVKLAQSQDQHDLELGQGERLAEAGAGSALKRPPGVLGHKIRVRGVRHEVALGQEALGIVEQILAAVRSAVVDKDCEWVRGPRLAFVVQVLARKTLAETDTRRRPQAQSLLDHGQGVRQVVHQVGVLAQHSRSSHDVGTENVIVFVADTLKDLGVLAKGGKSVLASNVSYSSRI
jgi:hypothetical protein